MSLRPTAALAADECVRGADLARGQINVARRSEAIALERMRPMPLRERQRPLVSARTRGAR